VKRSSTYYNILVMEKINTRYAEVSSARGNESNGSKLYNGHHFTTVYLSSVHSRKNTLLSSVSAATNTSSSIAKKRNEI
jgi:hypothetical protein